MSTDQPLRAESIATYILETFPGTRTDEAWGTTFFFYNPGGEGPDEFFFASLKTADDDHDTASDLNRPGVFRLSVGLPAGSYRSRFGPQPTGFGQADGPDDGRDYAALDRLLPHPVYAANSWVGVLNPSRATFEALRPLLEEAYEVAVGKYRRRHSSG
jgi:hypothetical protein